MTRGQIGEGGDVFYTIAHHIFTTRGLPVDEEWAAVIADEYRRAMRDLGITFKPKGPAPDRKRTENAQILTLLAALENGDVWIDQVDLPFRKHAPHPDDRDLTTVVIADTHAVCHVGQYQIQCRLAILPAIRQLRITALTAVQLKQGQWLSATHPLRAWLQSYRPKPELDVYSAALQKLVLDTLPYEPGERHWTVIHTDHHLQDWRYDTPDGSAILWRDGQGRTR